MNNNWKLRDDEEWDGEYIDWDDAGNLVIKPDFDEYSWPYIM